MALREFCVKQTSNQVRNLQHLAIEAWLASLGAFHQVQHAGPAAQPSAHQHQHGDLCNSIVFSSQELFPDFIMGVVDFGSTVTW